MKLKKGQVINIYTFITSRYTIEQIKYCHKEGCVMVRHSIYKQTTHTISVDRKLDDVIQELKIRGLENVKIDGKSLTVNED